MALLFTTMSCTAFFRTGFAAMKAAVRKPGRLKVLLGFMKEIVLLKLFGNAGKGNVLVAAVNKVAVDLVGQHRHMVLQAQLA